MSSTPPATPPTASGGSPSNPRTDSTPPSTRARQASLAVAGRKEIGDFWIGKVLGEGAFARVFAARLKDASKADFAIKVMEKKFIVKEGKSKEVQMERRVLSEVDHPNIVRLHYSFHDKERLYMVLDLCPGGELARVIRAVRKDGRALREPDARFYLCETVQAVQYLHGLGIIHRDIKPENVLLSASGHVKLTDFGTAKDANVKQELGEVRQRAPPDARH
jgi:3-phosphoinositide dependent protein kinase-1